MLDARFENIYNERLFALATLLDPRYKGKLFTLEQLEAVKVWVAEEAQRFSATAVRGESPPPAKRAKQDDNPSPLDVLDSILGGSAATGSAVPGSEVLSELATYLQSDPVTRSESAMEWWRSNATKFPTLAAIAKCFLCAPPSSVESERLFSAAAEIYTDRRNRLMPKNADMLLFLKHNLIMLKFSY